MTESRFSHIAQAIIKDWPQGLISLDSCLKITAFSPSAESLLGYEEQAVIGKHLHDLLCPNTEGHFHSKEACPLVTLLQTDETHPSWDTWWVNSEGEYVDVNVTAVHRSGQYPSFNSPSFRHLISFEIAPEDGLSRVQSSRLANFANLSPLPIAEINQAGSIEYANPAMIELMVDPGFNEYGHPKVLPSDLDAILATCINENKTIDSLETVCNDLVIRWTFSPITHSLPPMVHIIGNNISEMRKTQAQLETALEKAEVATETKSQFLANMSHEIRTPLTAIIGYAETLSDGTLQGITHEEAINTIISNGKQMLQIINDILDLSKIEARRLQVESIPTDIGEILSHIENVSSFQASEKGLKFDIMIDYPIPKQVVSDPVRVKQILFNLCSNALKFTHEGSVSVQVKFIKKPGLLEFAVTDTGIGISDEQAKNLFQAFSQADASTTRHFGGTGLGLIISRQLCEMMGGRLTLESKKDVGSTFTASIGIGAINKQYEMVNSAEELFTQTNNKTVTRKKFKGDILLADDHPENRRLIAMLLSVAGLNVTQAENGSEAFNLGLQNPYDLILMDIQMPEMDGLEATQLLRQCGFSNPIIALTANVMEDEIKHYLANGFTDCAGKPIDQSKLQETLAKYLEIDESNEKALDSSQSTTNNVSNQDLDSDSFYQSSTYHELVKSFLDSLEGELLLIDSALEAKDWEQTKKLIHKLKGAGGSFGLNEITRLATEIEAALNQTNNDQVLQLYPSLKSSIQSTLKSQSGHNSSKGV